MGQQHYCNLAKIVITVPSLLLLSAKLGVSGWVEGLRTKPTVLNLLSNTKCISATWYR